MIRLLDSIESLTQFLNPFWAASSGSSAANIAEDSMMQTRMMFPKVEDADIL